MGEIRPLSGGDPVALGRRLAVGRAPSNDLVLDARSVSAHHAIVEWRDGDVLIGAPLAAGGMGKVYVLPGRGM